MIMMLHDIDKDEDKGVSIYYTVEVMLFKILFEIVLCSFHRCY